MSKRAGNVVTIDDLVEAVGVDAARYSLARTDYNTSVDIDLDLLTSHSNENPVYYVQYAHARSCNVDRNAAAAGIGTEGADLSLLDTEADGEVLAALAQWPATLALAGDSVPRTRWRTIWRTWPVPTTSGTTSSAWFRWR